MIRSYVLQGVDASTRHTLYQVFLDAKPARAILALHATLDIFVSSSLFTVCKTALVESHVFTTKSSAALLLHKSF